MKRARSNVRQLPLPVKVFLLRDEGLNGFSKRIDLFGRTGALSPDEARVFKTWARTFLAHLATIEPTPRAQRAWLDDGARRRARMTRDAQSSVATKRAL